MQQIAEIDTVTTGLRERGRQKKWNLDTEIDTKSPITRIPPEKENRIRTFKSFPSYIFYYSNRECVQLVGRENKVIPESKK